MFHLTGNQMELMFIHTVEDTEMTSKGCMKKITDIQGGEEDNEKRYISI